MSQYPITPSTELVLLWSGMTPVNDAVQQNWIEIATQAARWGANMELDACCNEILAHPGFEQPELFVELLIDKRRPKQLSLKQRALHALDQIEDQILSADLASDIRTALEALDD